jgi:hypothetical protein
MAFHFAAESAPNGPPSPQFWQSKPALASIIVRHKLLDFLAIVPNFEKGLCLVCVVAVAVEDGSS